VQHGLEILERARANVLGLVLTNAERDGGSTNVVREYYHYR
jgi:hypothetical protein